LKEKVARREIPTDMLKHTRWGSFTGAITTHLRVVVHPLLENEKSLIEN
jgi:hypothetical protein